MKTQNDYYDDLESAADVSPAWFTPSRHDFDDGYGGSIVASRVV